MEDWLLFVVEKYTIKKQLMTIADMFNLFQDAVAADPGPHGATSALHPTGVAAKKGTSCTGITGHFDVDQQAYRPNLCRFGVECRDHVCELDTRGDCGGACTDDPANNCCDASQGICGNTGAPCYVNNPTDCNNGVDGPCFPSCGGSCDTSTSPNGSYVKANLTSGLGLNVPVLGSLPMEVCRVGRTSGECQGLCTNDNSKACFTNADCGAGTCTAPAPGSPCSADADCVDPAKCNLAPGEGAGAAFLTQGRVPSTAQAPSFLYLINQPSRSIFAGALPPAFQAFVSGLCVGIDRSEGWCDCQGAGLPINFLACQEHVTTPGATTDACGGPVDPNNEDSVYPGTVDGKLRLTTTGAGSVAGDCLDMVQVEFSALASSADLGPDGKACTEDDVAASTAPLQFPLTTGSATAELKNSPSTPGGCSGLAPGAVGCVQDVNCTQANCPSCPPGSTCTNPAPAPFINYSLTSNGSGVDCAQALTSNLGGLGITGAIPLAGLIPPSLGLGDVAAAFHFGCK
jgi:hypothetical protein